MVVHRGSWLAPREQRGWTATFLNPTWAIIYSAAGLVVLFLSQWYLGLCLLLCASYAHPIWILQLQKRWSTVLTRHKLNPTMTTGLLLGLFGGAMLGLAVASPAQAQFFTNAETFLSNFGLQPDIVVLVMNSIRAIFVLYLIFGLVQVINSVRQGEEWKEVAKVPFLVLMIGIFGDILVGAITG